MAIVSQIRSGIVSGLRNGVNTAKVSTDGALVYVPETAADFTALGIAAPSSLWLCQEASGNLSDSIGSVTLTANATPTYRNSVSGWSRYAVGSSEAANQRFRFAAGTYTPVANSAAWLVYIGAATPAGTRVFLRPVDGAVNAALSYLTTGKIRLGIGGVNADSTSTAYVSTGGATIHPVLYVYNRTASTVKVHTDLEEWSGTFADLTNDGNKGFFGDGGTSPASGRVNLVATWHGTSATTLTKATLAALGWPISY